MKLRFVSPANHSYKHKPIPAKILTAGSLVYMTQEIQKLWQHALPKSATEPGRMSLTFRQMI